MKRLIVTLIGLLACFAPHLANAQELGQRFRFLCYLKDIGHDPNPKDPAAVAQNNRFFFISGLFQRNEAANGPKDNLAALKIFDPNGLLLAHPFSYGNIRDDDSIYLVFGDPDNSKKSVLWGGKIQETNSGAQTRYDGTLASGAKGNPMDHLFGGYCFASAFAGGEAEFDERNAKFATVMQKK
jgi:hypothetical protein